MDFNKLTVKSQEAVAAAQELARRNGNPQIEKEHLLVALLDQELPQTLLGERAAATRARAEAAPAGKPKVSGAGTLQPQAHASFQRVVDAAFDEARKLED